MGAPLARARWRLRRERSHVASTLLVTLYNTFNFVSLVLAVSPQAHTRRHFLDWTKVKYWEETFFPLLLFALCVQSTLWSMFFSHLFQRGHGVSSFCVKPAFEGVWRWTSRSRHTTDEDRLGRTLCMYLPLHWINASFCFPSQTFLASSLPVSTLCAESHVCARMHLCL